MKKVKLLVTAMLLSTMICFSAFAGARTNVWEDGNFYEYNTFYVKDDGSYAKNEWIQDTDEKFYWVDEVGRLATNWGIATDGRLFGSNGELIPMDGRKFAVVEDFYKLQAGMTYDQAVSILGKEHEILFYDAYVIDKETGETEADMILAWYAQDNDRSIDVHFSSGVITDAYYGPRESDENNSLEMPN